ncbi:hypothetical protein E2C01_035850 [Portunus trituberculatus]|uniref:Uncharacterized protein n=1 Tax=Portunus trituberculatus TaxID=210409 RepID=A0A5B7FCK5_PORTR|nr:hypothetical protein [Portunus trituberculatus]
MNLEAPLLRAVQVLVCTRLGLGLRTSLWHDSSPRSRTADFNDGDSRPTRHTNVIQKSKIHRARTSMQYNITCVNECVMVHQLCGGDECLHEADPPSGCPSHFSSFLFPPIYSLTLFRFSHLYHLPSTSSAASLGPRSRDTVVIAK